MKSLPLISIALCTFNGEEYLQEQLNSILNQTYPNLEIVIVDDCSSDNTWLIIEECARKNHNIRIFRNSETLGYNKNFEKALLLCNGEKIAISDQDDIWHPEKIMLQYQALRDKELIYHDSELVNRSGMSLNVRISDKFNFYRGDNPEVFLFMNCVSGHSILMKKSLLKSALPFPPGLYYDHWLAFVATRKGGIDFIDTPLVKYRQHPKNNTDLLGFRAGNLKRESTIQKLYKERDWLRTCARYSEKNNVLIQQLFLLCEKRNSSFAEIEYGRLIWKNRRTLLTLLKKSEVSMFFYSLRKIWGIHAKMLV